MDNEMDNELNKPDERNAIEEIGQFNDRAAVNTKGASRAVPNAAVHPLQNDTAYTNGAGTGAGPHNGSAGQYLSNGNGTVTSSSAQNIKPDHALFWNSPLAQQGELNWFVPPVPSQSSETDSTQRMLSELGEMMEGEPKRAWLMKWNYRTRSAASAAELEHVEHEAHEEIARHTAKTDRDLHQIDTEISLLNNVRQELEKDLVDARNAFAEAAARTGFHCVAENQPSDAAPGRRQNKNAPPPEPSGPTMVSIARISPQVVEDGLMNSVPTLQEMAGEHGVGPIHNGGPMNLILQFLMQVFAPVVAGVMLALCLGTLVGILDLDTLQRSDSAPQLALAAALGFVIVYLMGELFHTSVASLSRSLEERDAERAHLPNVPRYRRNLGMAVGLLSIACVLGVAEVTAEGLGIRQLHQQQIARQNRFKGTAGPQTPVNGRPAPNATAAPLPESAELPLGIYLVIGTLISGPYIGYKTAKGWGENESQLREAWLTHRQRVWLDDRRANPDVQQAFHCAYAVEQMESNLHKTRSQLQHLEERRGQALTAELPATVQTRRREARAAAVGEAARLQQDIEDIVQAHEPLPQFPQSRNGNGSKNGNNSGGNGSSPLTNRFRSGQK